MRLVAQELSKEEKEQEAKALEKGLIKPCSVFISKRDQDIPRHRQVQRGIYKPPTSDSSTDDEAPSHPGPSWWIAEKRMEKRKKRKAEIEAEKEARFMKRIRQLQAEIREEDELETSREQPSSPQPEDGLAVQSSEVSEGASQENNFQEYRERENFSSEASSSSATPSSSSSGGSLKVKSIEELRSHDAQLTEFIDNADLSSLGQLCRDLESASLSSGKKENIVHLFDDEVDDAAVTSSVTLSKYCTLHFSSPSSSFIHILFKSSFFPQTKRAAKSSWMSITHPYSNTNPRSFLRRSNVAFRVWKSCKKAALVMAAHRVLSRTTLMKKRSPFRKCWPSTTPNNNNNNSSSSSWFALNCKVRFFRPENS